MPGEPHGFMRVGWTEAWRSVEKREWETQGARRFFQGQVSFKAHCDTTHRPTSYKGGCFRENSRPFRKAAEQSETDEDGLKVLRQSQGLLVSTISKDGQAITSVTYNLRVLITGFPSFLSLKEYWIPSE